VPRRRRPAHRAAAAGTLLHPDDSKNLHPSGGRRRLAGGKQARRLFQLQRRLTLTTFLTTSPRFSVLSNSRNRILFHAIASTQHATISPFKTFNQRVQD